MKMFDWYRLKIFLSLIRSHCPAASYSDHEDPYPSLSDYHDYEPNLEFDDTELESGTTVAGKYFFFFF